ncbi:MAG: nucleoside triphosphate pyrophosphohydrolase [Deltaproteobacteria bacterium]|nr:nucleoside triphosphate pyrophosphohydrolase [Deltaproteobacteria bacterium]MBW2015649.1 nucleoside triphosphate pyrophosphohydrolase [Deltaproteobacteria bacterium]MBW2128356.1 nucleoside triphosphate pyrophosphohydrolase [Deltaproteobacteria bacterium]MBW2302510.1 nucleoside triphosphate pyrophosphohydrolase [Deltaproteobacteria bacterium]
MKKEELSRAFIALSELLETLRSPGGCPWDARQTDDTVKMYLLEEAYEVLDAVEKGDSGELCGELGDLLFQILFLARLAEERGEFDLLDVLQGITRKMRVRHPHVFGTLELESPEEVAENWARIKKKEKADLPSTANSLDSVPAALPALQAAHRLTERASREGWRGPGGGVWEALNRELKDIKAFCAAGDKEKAGRRIGSLMFLLAHLAGTLGLNAEHLLRMTNRDFVRQFERTCGAGKDSVD